jgi:NAD(P)H-dependent FMN reductase
MEQGEGRMKKVTAFVGSATKKHTLDAVQRFLRHLKAMGEVQVEIVVLGDQHLEICRGCKLCFEQGEQACPLNDDRDALLERLLASDGVVFASPSYMFQVSGLMKTLIDRFAFVGHRPRFFGKAFTNIVVQGLPMDAKIGKYLNLVGSCFGFTPVRGSRITTREPMMPQDEQKMERILAKHAERFMKALAASVLPSPKLTLLMGFRIGRTTMRAELDSRNCDYRYYQDHGWFDADYYYPVRLNPLKKAVGWTFDAIARGMTRRRLNSLPPAQRTRK